MRRAQHHTAAPAARAHQHAVHVGWRRSGQQPAGHGLCACQVSALVLRSPNASWVLGWVLGCIWV
jgi:hypothetical protein